MARTHIGNFLEMFFNNFDDYSHHIYLGPPLPRDHSSVDGYSAIDHFHNMPQ